MFEKKIASSGKEERQQIKERELLAGNGFGLAQNDKEAEYRFNEYRNKDPFPEILPALLNSGDVFKYVEKTGMLYPFDIKSLRGASYEVPLKGEVIYWDDTGAKKKFILGNNTDCFELKPNSIAFVSLEPMFRIPYYMALRFNLKIIHVYKGLLLGTGPLVDPGFVGYLSIPLHNLTSNTYIFHGEDKIIEMEFTKISSNNYWNDEDKKKTVYIRNMITPNRKLDDYINNAIMSNGIETSVIKSSIPEEINRLREESEYTNKNIQKSQESIEKKLEHSNVFSIIGVIGFLAALISVCAFGISALRELNESYISVPSQMSVFKEENENMKKEIELLKQHIRGLENGKTEED